MAAPDLCVDSQHRNKDVKFGLAPCVKNSKGNDHGGAEQVSCSLALESPQKTIPFLRPIIIILLFVFLVLLFIVFKIVTRNLLKKNIPKIKILN